MLFIIRYLFLFWPGFSFIDQRKQNSYFLMFYDVQSQNVSLYGFTYTFKKTMFWTMVGWYFVNHTTITNSHTYTPQTKSVSYYFTFPCCQTDASNHSHFELIQRYNQKRRSHHSIIRSAIFNNQFHRGFKFFCKPRIKVLILQIISLKVSENLDRTRT